MFDGNKENQVNWLVYQMIFAKITWAWVFATVALLAVTLVWFEWVLNPHDRIRISDSVFLVAFTLVQLGYEYNVRKLIRIRTNPSIF